MTPLAGGVLLLTITSTVASPPPADDTKLHRIAESDPDWAIVRAEVARIEEAEPHSPVGNRIEAVGRIEAEAIRVLFPEVRFYGFRYSNYVKRGFTADGVSLAAGLGHTLAVFPSEADVLRLNHWGNYQSFGELLRKGAVAIRTADEARLVWTAFCEVHRKAWGGDRFEKVSAREWRLGIQSSDQTVSDVDGHRTVLTNTYYARVATDPVSGRIMDWSLVVDRGPSR